MKISKILVKNSCFIIVTFTFIDSHVISDNQTKKCSVLKSCYISMTSISWQPITACAQPTTACAQPFTACAQPVTACAQPITACAQPTTGCHCLCTTLHCLCTAHHCLCTAHHCLCTAHHCLCTARHCLCTAHHCLWTGLDRLLCMQTQLHVTVGTICLSRTRFHKKTYTQ